MLFNETLEFLFLHVTDLLFEGFSRRVSSAL
jgi:hypothetical protein